MKATENFTEMMNRQLFRRMLIGYAIGMIVILYFVLSANVQAVWGKYWMIQPLLVTPLAGAVGGFCFHFLDFYYGRNGGTAKIIANILGVAIFIFGLWMGIVLGLHGTMWN